MSSYLKKIFSILLFIIIICIISIESDINVYALANQTEHNLSNNFNFSQFLLSPNLLMMYLLQQETDLEENLYKKDSLDRINSMLWQKSMLNSPYNRYKTNQRQSRSLLIKTKLDSTGNQINNSESVNGIEVTPTYDLKLDDYLRLRKEKLQLKMWDSLTTEYDMKKALSSKDLSRMLSSATGLEIPLPPSPLLGIFGKPEVSINVNGEVNLRMGWRWDKQNLGTVSAFGQSQSSPIFSQDIRVNVSGGIGDKVKLSTDWNTKTTFNRDNKFKVGFDGYDDDIVKKVEFGNVTLPLTSSLIGGGQALFGVRADFQFGPLFLKTLLSQKKGERKFIDVRGGTSKQYFSIRAYDYARNHFFLDTAYKSIYKEYFITTPGIIPLSANKTRVKTLEVWESNNILGDVKSTAATAAKAFADLEPIPYKATYPDAYKSLPIQSGIVESGRFNRLDTNQYKYDRNLGTLVILNLKTDRTYAVGYKIENTSTGPDDDLYVGTLNENAKLLEKDTLILKLIYRQSMQPGFKSIWSRQMKNIYSINAANINMDETKIGIWYQRQSNDSTDVLTGAPDKVVTILGVDRVDQAGQVKPDGQFDLKNSPFFSVERGEINFPTIEPFREGLRDYFTKIGNPAQAEGYIYNEVYDTTYDVAKRNTSRDRFMITGEVSGKSSGRVALGAFNLAPGSVRATLNGVPMKEYTDFVVDYTAGLVTFKNEQANLPNANVRVEYEQQNIFDVATKTQAGLRADYRVFKGRHVNADLGFTFMHYNQSYVVDRVQLGQEPVANSMFGFDAKLTMDAPWLTELLDLLPFYDTKVASSFAMSGEWAMMLPTPNKRTSTVASDNGQPVVYIDDFDGAQRYISLGINPSQWTHSSQPMDTLIGSDDITRSLYRGKFLWYKHFLPYVPSKEVYPNKETYAGNSNIAPLELYFDPNRRGIYNRNENFLDEKNPEFANQNPKWTSIPENKQKIWGGMQRLLSSFNTNFDNENIEFIEITMKWSNGSGGYEPGKTKMYIDLGQVSEDIIPNQSLNTEDGSTAANPIPNGRIDAGEDRGIDTLSNAQEKLSYPTPLNLENDPARDDYSFDFTKSDDTRKLADWENYNNYEGNASFAELGQFPDKEILNENNGQTIALDNSYFRYEVNLEPTPGVNPQIVGGANGWFVLRIPVRKPDSKVGNPLFSNIQYARVSVKGGFFASSIVDWRLIGSQWQRIHNFQSNLSPNDSILQLAFVNLFENSQAPDYYTMPPGVLAPLQPNADPSLQIRLNEQSLAISVRNLRYGEERMAARIMQRQDIFNYKKLKFFFHGDGSMPDNLVAGAIPKGYAFMRFGIDSNNYYEYRRPITRGWQDVEINLQELTAIKQIRDTSRILDRQTYPLKNDPLAKFSIRGDPILTKIQFYAVGIANPNEQFPNELTTTVWIDELRLIEPEQSNDWAAVASASLKLADLATVDASVNRQEPNFHKLEERFGNRTSQSNFTVTMTGNLEKFAPTSFSAMKIPITYTHAEFLTDPKYVANSDVNLQEASIAAKNNLPITATEAERKAAADAVLGRSQSLKVQDSWALTSIKLGIPIKFFLIDQTLNKITFGYSYSQEFERSPLYAEKFNWMWKTNAQYSNSLGELLPLEPLSWAKEVPILKTYSKWKMNLLPSSITLGIDVLRRRQTEQSRFLDVPSPVIRDFTTKRAAQFSWKLSQGGLLSPTIDYTVNTLSTLLPYELDDFGKQRTGRDIGKEIFFKDGSIFKFGENSQHTQNITINLKPMLPDIYGMNKYLEMTGSFITDYNWNNPLQPDPNFTDRAKNTGFNNKIRFNNALSLQSLADEWFKIQKETPFRVATKDSLTGVFGNALKVIKTVLLDFRRVDFTFDQTNAATNPGVFGGNGLNNLWGRGLTFRQSENIYGPSFAYQLGLIENPHGDINLIKSSAFPFFAFTTTPGLRPANSIMQDNYTQKTNFKITTSRTLWEGATLDLSWKTDLGYNRNQTVITGVDKVPNFSNIVALESFNRTFVSFPSVFGINLFNNRIENVVNSFNKKKDVIENDNTLDTIQKNRKIQAALAESFSQSLEAFSFSSGRAARFLPSMNWGIRWEGLEKFPLWSDYVRRIQIEHTYTSTYDESIKIDDAGRVIQNQSVQTGFSPLFGMTVSFDEKKMDGRLTATLKWNSTNNFNLNSAARSAISSQSTNEFSLQSNYVLKGFTFPLFGLDLKNDLEFSLLISYKKNSTSSYDVLNPQTYLGNSTGQQLKGDSQIIIEPKARYSMSNRVTATWFFRYEGNSTAGAAAPGFSTTQVGLDIRISLAGGR